MPAIGTVWAAHTWNDNDWALHTWADAQSPSVVGGYTVGANIGDTETLVAGVVYALPPRRTLCNVQQSGGTIEVSEDGVTFAAITLDTNKQFEAGGTFIRAVTTNAIVRFTA